MEVSGLQVYYSSQQALGRVTLPIRKEAITALVGPSGSGKTTFLLCLNRLTDLIPGCRVEGSIRLHGEEILGHGCNLLRLRRRVGMIFQKPNPFPFSIRRNFTLPLREHGMKDRQEQEARLEQVLRAVGLWSEVKDRLHRPAPELSGGQQQRLCIARALALEPEVLLLDEPCSALDPLSSGIVEDLITSLRNRYTLVIVTHNLPQARRIADFASLFWNVEGVGRLVESAPIQSFFEAPTEKLTRDYVAGVRG